MVLTSWLKLFARRLFLRRNSFKGRRRPPTRRREFDRLEDRILLSGDAPTWETDEYEFDLSPQAHVGRTIGVVQAEDAEDDPITYTLTGSSYFAIDDETGVITLADAAALTADDTYELTVTADDGTDVSETTVSIHITGITLAAGGAYAATGGVAGNDVQVTPFEGFTPEALGNDETTETLAGDWERDVLIDGVAYTGEGDQELIRTVTFTDAGDADEDGISDGWSYFEHVVWMYDLLAIDAEGNSNHVWGMYEYTFSAVFVPGVLTTSFDFTSVDNYASNITYESETSSFTVGSTGTYTYTLSIESIDNTSGPDSGSLSESVLSTAAMTGLGAYEYAVAGGSVSGTLTGNSNDTNTSMYAVGFTQDTSGNWSASGISSASGSGLSHFGYSGGGTYGDARFAGTIQESGAQDSNYQYTSSGILSLGEWTTTGLGTAGGSQSQSFSYDGAGTYSSSEESETRSVTRSGTNSASGHTITESEYSISYAPVSGAWVTTSGTGSGSGDWASESSYDGGGTYSREENGGTVSGTFNEDGADSAWNTYTTSMTLVAGEWVVSGEGDAGAAGNAHYDYTGTGTYSKSKLEEDETKTYEEATSGSVQEGGFETTAYESSSEWALGSAGWVLAAGTGSETGSNGYSYSYDGEGEYFSFTHDTASGYFSEAGGQITQSGGENHTSSWSAQHGIADGAWVQTGGTGSGGGGTNSLSSYSGSGSYDSTGEFGAAISGSTTEGGGSNSNSTYTTTSNWVSGGWVTTGTSTETGGSASDFTYDGTGTYGWEDLPDDDGFGSSSFSGTVTEGGGRSTTGDYTVEHELDAEGEWVAVDGQNTATTDSDSHVRYSGDGTYELLGADEDYGVWFVEGTTHAEGTETSDQTTLSVDEIQDGEWVTTFGTGVASGARTWSANSNGTGGYLYDDGVLSFSGAATQGHTESGHFTSETTLSYVPAQGGEAGRWQESGDGSGGSNYSDNLAFTISNGTYSYGVPGGTISGTTTGSATREYTWTSEYESELVHVVETPSSGPAIHQDVWELTSGEATETFTSGTNATYEGSGSYTQTIEELDEDEQVIATQTFTGDVTESGSESFSVGTFAEYTVVDAAWSLSDFGDVVTSEWSDTYEMTGEGSWSRLGMGGTFSQSDYSYQTGEATIEDGLIDGRTGTRDVETGAQNQFSWNGSGLDAWAGTVGTLTVGGTDNSGWTSNVHSELVNLELEEGEEGPDFEFRGVSGTAHVWGDRSNTESYEGDAEGFNGYEGEVTYSWGETSESDWDETYTYVPPQTEGSGSGSGGGSGNSSDDEPSPWVLQTGTANSSGSANHHYFSDGSREYEAAFGLTGIETESTWDNWEMSWQAESTYVPPDPENEVAGGWTTTGSGSGGGDTGGDWTWGASGSVSTADLSANFFEHGEDHYYVTYGVDYTWDPSEPGAQATGAPGAWVTTGSGSGGGYGQYDMTFDSTRAWTGLTQGGTISGTTTANGNETSEYEYDETWAYGGSGWARSGGSGTGSGSADFSSSSSGSGDYSYEFDTEPGASTTGVVTGTVTNDSHDRWDYSYEQTFVVAGGGWGTLESGSGSYDGHRHTAYSGDGTYTVVTEDSGTDGYYSWDDTETVTATVDESGDELAEWEGTIVWDALGWTREETWTGASTSDYRYTRETTWLDTDEWSGGGHSGGGMDEGTITYGYAAHAESEYTNTLYEDLFIDVATWNTTSTGTASGFTEETTEGEGSHAYDHTYVNGDYTEWSEGEGTWSHSGSDEWDWNEAWDHQEDHTGESTTLRDAFGSHAWGHGSAFSNSEAWGSSSGSGSGSGSSSGSSSTSASTSSSSGVETWEEQFFQHTPASEQGNPLPNWGGYGPGGGFGGYGGYTNGGETQAGTAGASGPWGTGTGNATGTQYADNGEGDGEGASQQGSGSGSGSASGEGSGGEAAKPSADEAYDLRQERLDNILRVFQVMERAQAEADRGNMGTAEHMRHMATELFHQANAIDERLGEVGETQRIFDRINGGQPIGEDDESWRADNAPSGWDDYVHYLWNPSEQDQDVQIAQIAAVGVAGAALTTIVGIYAAPILIGAAKSVAAEAATTWAALGETSFTIAGVELAGVGPVGLTITGQQAAAIAGALIAYYGGETAATSLGRHMHQTWDYGEGYEREFRRVPGIRPDAVNVEEGIVKELKPNNTQAISRGLQQLERYAVELERVFGKPFRRFLDLY
jgi:hypothetical protein